MSDITNVINSIVQGSDIGLVSFLIFTARSSYASAVLEIVILSVRLSVCHTRAL